MQDPNFEAKERAAGLKAAAALRGAYRNIVKSTFKRKSGTEEKSNFSPRFREGRLDRIVMQAPHYSFKKHYGSTKTGTNKASKRSAHAVKAHTRQYEGMVRTVRAHNRRATTVGPYKKNIDYKAYNHIAMALKASNALNQLATELGQNRIISITSQIDF
jgi:hypothetical protein